jgi:hypothetical protein
MRWRWVSLMLAVSCGGPPGASGPGAHALVLGVEPVPGPDDAGVAATELVAWVGGLTPEGGLGLPESSAITVSCTSGGPCTATGAGVQRPGAQAGVLAVIVDNSGSNGASASTCVGCPTDPMNQRAVAVRELLRRLFGRAPDWRVGLFDFGWNPNGGRVSTAQLAGYSSFAADFDPAIDAWYPGYGTYLYDALVDVLPTVAGELVAQDGGVPGRVLVVSDGEDTSSTHTLAEGLALARSYGVPVDTVGYGQRGEGGTVVLAPRAVRDLRRIATETGGFCTIVSADELPALFARIGELYVAGYAERRFSFPAATGPVTGTVALDEGPQTPFLFEDFR